MSSVPVGNIFQIFKFVKQSSTWIKKGPSRRGRRKRGGVRGGKSERAEGEMQRGRSRRGKSEGAESER
jgi:hypothetical protein